MSCFPHNEFIPLNIYTRKILLDKVPMWSCDISRYLGYRRYKLVISQNSIKFLKQLLAILSNNNCPISKMLTSASGCPARIFDRFARLKIRTPILKKFLQSVGTTCGQRKDKGTFFSLFCEIQILRGFFQYHRYIGSSKTKGIGHGKTMFCIPWDNFLLNYKRCFF